MINPLASTMTPDPWPRSLGSRWGASRLKNSSPKNLRKNGSSNEPCGLSPDFPLRDAAMLTTAGFTDFAISTKFLPSPPAIGNCGAVTTGRMMGLGIGSGPAVPVGNQPMLDATTIPMMIPPLTKVNGISHARMSFIGGPCSSSFVTRIIHTQSIYPVASLDLAGIDPHDRVEKLHGLCFRRLKRVAPDDRAETAALTNGARLLKHIRVLALGPSRENDDPAPIKRALYHMPDSLCQRGDRNFG